MQIAEDLDVLRQQFDYVLKEDVIDGAEEFPIDYVDLLDDVFHHYYDSDNNLIKTDGEIPVGMQQVKPKFCCVPSNKTCVWLAKELGLNNIADLAQFPEFYELAKMQVAINIVSASRVRLFSGIEIDVDFNSKSYTIDGIEVVAETLFMFSTTMWDEFDQTQAEQKWELDVYVIDGLVSDHQMSRRMRQWAKNFSKRYK